MRALRRQLSISVRRSSVARCVITERSRAHAQSSGSRPPSQARYQVTISSVVTAAAYRPIEIIHNQQLAESLFYFISTIGLFIQTQMVSIINLQLFVISKPWSEAVGVDIRSIQLEKRFGE
ncbi:hypothetical protein J6590_071199 [Homalodisca vitripennis]|nr:hypothetical protein J6590_071199 [Homalodisca vitripennis]